MAMMRDVEGKSFAWAFWVAAVMFSCGAWWGGIAGLGIGTRTLLLVLAGGVPLAIQLLTGLGLDRAWVARFGKSAHPVEYRRSMTVAIVAAVASALGAWLFLADAG